MVSSVRVSISVGGIGPYSLTFSFCAVFSSRGSLPTVSTSFMERCTMQRLRFDSDEVSKQTVSAEDRHGDTLS